MKLTINNQIRIEEPQAELLQYLKDILTLPNPKWEEAKKFGRGTWNIPKDIVQYEVVGNTVQVPRGLLEHLLDDLGYDFEVVDETVMPRCPAWPAPKVSLRPGDQEPAVTELLRHPNGFFSAPAGAGKTVCGLEICRRLGLKTLWLVHQTHLLEQAVSEAEEHFGLDRKEIGTIQGKKRSIGERLTVGMIPTMRKLDLSAEADQFGLIIVDEAHHVPCNTFLAVLSHFRSGRIYGLTATAYRNDGLENLMFNAVGPVKAKIEHDDLFEDEHLIKPEILIRKTGWLPPNSDLLQYHEFMEKMVEDRYRNLLLVHDVVRETRAGHPAIVLVDRTKHAEVLTEMLRGYGVRCEFVVGSVDVQANGRKKQGRGKNKRKKRILPKKLREKILKDFKDGTVQCLVATYDLLAEGFNYKPLSRLFLGSPVKYKGTVTQAVGRVQRPCEGKADAKVFDYVDELIPMFDRQARARIQEVYQPMEMPIRMLTQE